MKTAIYIEDGVVQLVITPTTKFEKNALTSFQGKPLKVRIMTGEFYHCQGGWIRQRNWGAQDPYNSMASSLILQIKEEKDAGKT